MREKLQTLLIFTGILCWGMIFLFFSIYQYPNTISQYQWIIISIFSLLWILLWIVWNNKNQNIKYFKNILIIIEIYLLGLLFIQNHFNLSYGEFTVLVWSGGVLFQLSKKRNIKYRILSFFISLIIIQLLITNFLMVYRDPLPKESIKPIEVPSIKILSQDILDPEKWYFEIINQNLNTKKKFYFLNKGEQTIDLLKEGNYHFIFALQHYSDLFQIFLLHPQGEIIQFFPQSNAEIFISKSDLNIIQQIWKIEKYQFFQENDNLIIQNIQKSFLYHQQKQLLSSIPNYIQYNPKIAYMSKYFTKYLAQIYPFFYKKNWNYFLEYENYLNINKKISKKSVYPAIQEIKSHFDFKENFINISKFKKYL